MKLCVHDNILGKLYCHIYIMLLQHAHVFKLIKEYDPSPASHRRTVLPFKDAQLLGIEVELEPWVLVVACHCA